MNLFTEIGDDNFVPFLSNLGVDTYEKSFDWMLHDPNFSGVLKWLYNNLDRNNALSAREEYRFSELQNKGLLLTPDVLDTTLSSIQESYPGLCLPGDHESKEDLELSIKMLSERLQMLESRETGLVDFTEELNTQLQQELTSLNAAYQQSLDDQSKAAEECINLAQELDTMMDGVIDVIAKNIEVYASCRDDKQIAKRFFVFNPIEAYRQTQALFQTQFQVFFSENLKTIESNAAERDFKVALSGARNLEARLTSAAIAFIESKAQLRGAQSQLALVSNYEHIHPSQVRKRLIEARSALELLQEEETMVEQQMRVAAAVLGRQRTQLAVHTVTSAALASRLHINTSLTLLTELWHQAMTLDKLLYYCLRHELRTLEEFLQFAHQLKQYVIAENLAVGTRIESMKEIISEQEISETNRSNLLLRTLFAIFNSETKDEPILVKLYSDLQTSVKELKDNVKECYRNKEEKLVEIKTSTTPLRAYIYDGCTNKPNSRDRTVAALTHTLKQRLEVVDKRMLDTGGAFTTVKNGDKHNLRKLWQWFLTDPAKLISALKSQGSY